MPAGDVLRARLGDLVRSRRSAVPVADLPDAPATAGPRRHRAKRADAVAMGVEAFLPGGEWRDGIGGVVYVHERLRSAIEPPRPHWGRLPQPPTGEPELAAIASRGLDRALFLDLETCGLSSSPVFLAGTMHWNGEDFVLRQYFARHYGEEAALLEGVVEQVVVEERNQPVRIPAPDPVVIEPRHLRAPHVARAPSPAHVELQRL